MIVSDIVGIIALGLTLIAQYEVMLIGRLLAGFLGGVNNVVVAMYLVEISPLSMVGATGSFSIIVLEIFALVSFGLGFIVPSEKEGGFGGQIWRLLYFFPALLNIVRLLCLLMVFKHDTPFYCIEKNDKKEAMKGLNQIFNKNVEEEFNRIQSDVNAASTAGSVQIKDLFGRKYRKAFLLCLLLAVAQQLCGISVLFVYSNDIFSKSTDTPVFYTTLFGITNVVAVILSFKFVDKLGRKTLIIFGNITIGLVMLAFGLIAKISGEGNPLLKYLIVIWPLFFQASLGSLTFLYISEVLPDVGVGACISANWTTGFLIAQFYLQSVEAFGFEVPFLFFGVANFLCAVVFCGALVETRGKTKADIIAEYNLLPKELMNSINDYDEEYHKNSIASLGA